MSILEKRNTLDQRFIQLRQIFHQFQTTVRFSTNNSNSQVFANQLKCYQFLGQLEQHFLAQNVSHLYQFVHSIFSLIFTMIRQGPSQKVQKFQTTRRIKTTDISTQTQQTYQQVPKKLINENNSYQNTRHKKRSCLQIEIFEKDITQMNFRQRRRALQKMRDMIYEQEEVSDGNNFIKDFKPNIDRIQYSHSDQNIKSAIDKLKESDISTHIFLKHLMQQFIEIKDIKSSSQLLNKQLIQSMSKAITKYKGTKMKYKQKFKLFNHTIQQVIYPTINNLQYKISINQIHQYNHNDTPQMFNHNQNSQSVLQNISNLNTSNFNSNSYSTNSNSNKTSPKSKVNIKRSKFPSLMLKKGQSLNTISQIKSQSSISSSKSSITSKNEKKKTNRRKIRSSFSQNTLSNKLINSQLQKLPSRKIIEDNNNQIQMIPQKNMNQSRFRPRQSFRLKNNEHEKNDLIDRQKQRIKAKELINNKKLRKRTGSNYFDRLDDKVHRKSLQVN